MKGTAEHSVTVVEARNGQPSLKVRAADGVERPLHSLYDPGAEAVSIVDAVRFDGAGMLVVLGLGLGYHVAEAAARHPEAEIVVIEADEDISDAQSRHGPELGGRVRVIAGLPAGEALKEVSRLQMRDGMSRMSVCALSSAVSAFPEYYKPLLESLGRTVSLRLWERLRYPKFRGEKLRVTILYGGYFLNAELENALKGLGHEVSHINAVKGEGVNEVTGRVTANILEFRPDFFLTVNHLGFDKAGMLSSLFRSVKMPAASWYVDSPNLIVGGFERNASPYVSVFVWDRRYVDSVKAMGFEDVSYLPLAADEAVFRPMKLSAKQARKYGCPVGFAGSSMVKRTRERMERLPRELHPFVEGMAEMVSESRMSFEDALEAAGAEVEGSSRKLRFELEGAVLWKATLLYRLSCVRALRGTGLRIHGDDGWKSLLGDGYELRPVLNYYRHLPVLYNACDINFNATSLQMESAVNQRVFDVPACGGFLLTDGQESLGELFGPEEVISYSHRDEIPGLVKHYLRHPEERKRVANRARLRVLAGHTYRHRLKSIVQKMRSRYA